MQQDENTILYDGYIFSKDLKHLTFFIHTVYPSSNTKMNEGLATLINACVNELKQKEDYKEIKFNCFGTDRAVAKQFRGTRKSIDLHG